MHMGYIFLGIASFGVLGVTGAVVLMFAHGLSIALLFGIAGELRRRTGTLAFDELGGLAQSDAFCRAGVWTWRIRGNRSARLREFCRRNHDFLWRVQERLGNGRLHIFQIATVLALWGVVISAVYMLRAYRQTFMGNIREQWQKLPDLRPALRVPVMLLVAALLCCGFFPQSFVRMVTPTFRNYLSANVRYADL